MIMKIRDLIENIDYEYLQGNLDDEVKGLAHDNRLLKPQEGFICIAGTRFDSHDLISDVVAKGASLIGPGAPSLHTPPASSTEEEAVSSPPVAAALWLWWPKKPHPDAPVCGKTQITLSHIHTQSRSSHLLRGKLQELKQSSSLRRVHSVKC